MGFVREGVLGGSGAEVGLVRGRYELVKLKTQLDMVQLLFVL